MKKYNQSVIDQAQSVIEAAQARFFSTTGEGAVTLGAIAGAGKSRLVTDTANKCRLKKIRVAVAAPTNEQVFSLVHSIAQSDPSKRVGYIPKKDLDVPAWVLQSNVDVISPAYAASAHDLVVGTIDKFAEALLPRQKKTPALTPFDALIIDESYQANAGRYFALAAIAPVHMCVGDSGQIKPFSTVKAGRQWKGLLEDPLQSAVDVLHSNHPQTPHFQLPITWRLDQRGSKLAKHFYPADHSFGAAVADGVRKMVLAPALGGSARLKAIDKTLEESAKTGWGYIEMPDQQTLTADPNTAGVIVELITRLRGRSCTVSCELNSKATPLAPERIAVAVSHNDQKALLRSLLDRAGHEKVVVNTANKLQGLQFDFLVAWHPLSGLYEVDEFHLEAGRLCVMCTRHRHACVVVGRRGDRDLVNGPAPASAASPDYAEESDQILIGWQVHRSVFTALSEHVVQIP